MPRHRNDAHTSSNQFTSLINGLGLAHPTTNDYCQHGGNCWMGDIMRTYFVMLALAMLSSGCMTDGRKPAVVDEKPWWKDAADDASGKNMEMKSATIKTPSNSFNDFKSEDFKIPESEK